MLIFFEVLIIFFFASVFSYIPQPMCLCLPSHLCMSISVFLGDWVETRHKQERRIELWSYGTCVALGQGWGVKEDSIASAGLQQGFLGFVCFSLVLTLGDISDIVKDVFNLPGLLLFSWYTEIVICWCWWGLFGFQKS